MRRADPILINHTIYQHFRNFYWFFLKRKKYLAFEEVFPSYFSCFSLSFGSPKESPWNNNNNNNKDRVQLISFLCWFSIGCAQLMEKTLAYALVSLAEPELNGTSLIIFPFVYCHQFSLLSSGMASPAPRCKVRTQHPGNPDHAMEQPLISERESMQGVTVPMQTNKRTKPQQQKTKPNLFFPGFKASNNFAFVKSNWVVLR